MTHSPRPPHPSTEAVAIEPLSTGAAVLDADGVLTDSRALRAAAWQDTLDSYATQYSRITGRPRHHSAPAPELLIRLTGLLDRDTAAALLRAHHYRTDLAEWHLGPSGADLLNLLTSQTDRRFTELLRAEGAHARPGAGRLLLDLRSAGIRTAAVSTGRHCEELLRSAGLAHLVEYTVDAADAERYRLGGPPDPALHQFALKLVHATAGRAALLTDSPDVAAAGRRAGFGRVITVTRHRGGVAGAGAATDLESVAVRPGTG